MSETVYIQIDKNVQVNKLDVHLSDIADVFCKDKNIQARINAIKLIKLPDVPKKRVCFSIMYVIKKINEIYPDVEVNNIGESDFIVDYIKEKKKSTFVHKLIIAITTVFVFIGSAYAIMALAAEMVANSDDNTIAAICSERCAELYGLEIVKRDIADNPDNTTRFICISKRPEVTPDADIISICMSLPHTTGSLYRMLIRFALYGLNITKIESAPVPQAKQDIKRETFDVVFYLDFEGNALATDGTLVRYSGTRISRNSPIAQELVFWNGHVESWVTIQACRSIGQAPPCISPH